MTAALAPFLETILPIFAVPALGFLFGFRGLFTHDMAAGINRFVFYVANPALIFGLLSQAPFEGFQWGMIGLYMLASAVLYPIGYLIARRGFGRSPAESLLLGMAGCFPNHVLFVLPIVTELYGEAARTPLAAVITIDSVVFFGATLVVMDVLKTENPSPGRVLAAQLRNPITMSIVIGIAVNALRVPVHEGLLTYARFAGVATAPAAMFALGIILSQANLRRWGVATFTVSFTKLAIHPMLAFLFFSAAGAAWTEWTTPVLMTAAGPTAAMPFVIALQYGVPTDTITKVILITTALSVFTLSALA